VLVTREDGHSILLVPPAAAGGPTRLAGTGNVEEMTVATPVCIDGEILVRTHDALWCIGAD